MLFSNSCFFATRIPVYATSRTQNYSHHICESNLGDEDVSGMAKFMDFLMLEEEVVIPKLSFKLE